MCPFRLCRNLCRPYEFSGPLDKGCYEGGQCLLTALDAQPVEGLLDVGGGAGVVAQAQAAYPLNAKDAKDRAEERGGA